MKPILTKNVVDNKTEFQGLVINNHFTEGILDEALNIVLIH